MSIFESLDKLRGTPIPDQTEARARKEGFRSHAIDKNCAAFGEAMVNLTDHGIAGENYYNSTRNPPYWRRIEGSIPELWARRAVALKLSGINAVLREGGMELFVFDAWRPRAVQAYFHDVWMPQEVRKRSPSICGRGTGTRGGNAIGPRLPRTQIRLRRTPRAARSI